MLAKQQHYKISILSEKLTRRQYPYSVQFEELNSGHSFTHKNIVCVYGLVIISNCVYQLAGKVLSIILVLPIKIYHQRGKSKHLFVSYQSRKTVATESDPSEIFIPKFTSSRYWLDAPCLAFSFPWHDAWLPPHAPSVRPSFWRGLPCGPPRPFALTPFAFLSRRHPDRS